MNGFGPNERSDARTYANEGWKRRAVARDMRNWVGLRIHSAGGYFPGMARGEPTKTIAHARAGGETALTVHCLGFGCYHQAVKTFEELKLWNDMIFVDVSVSQR